MSGAEYLFQRISLPDIPEPAVEIVASCFCRRWAS